MQHRHLCRSHAVRKLRRSRCCQAFIHLAIRYHAFRSRYGCKGLQGMPTIGIAAKRVGCNVETVRYYERIGLLQAPPRAARRRRSYSDDEIRHLQFIRRCRDLGFTLKEIKTLISLSGAATQNCNQVRLLAEAQIDSVRQKIADLTRVEDWLGAMIEQCAAPQHVGCPMIETLFATVASAPGADNHL